MNNTSERKTIDTEISNNIYKGRGVVIGMHLLTDTPLGVVNTGDNNQIRTCTTGGVLRIWESAAYLKRIIREFALYQLGIKGGIRTRKYSELIHSAVEGLGFTKDKLSIFNDKLKEIFPENTVFFYAGDNGFRLLAEYYKDTGFIEDEVFTKKKVNGKDVTVLTKKAIYHVKKYLNIPWDIAMFGRMAAFLPDFEVQAAVRCSHGESIHECYPAKNSFVCKEELNQEEERGSAHLGASEIASYVKYHYIDLNMGQLCKNRPDGDTVGEAVSLIKAALLAVPKNHQSSNLAVRPASYARIIISNAGRSTMASFSTPVQAGYGGGFLKPGIRALNECINEDQRIYGTEDIILDLSYGFQAESLTATLEKVELALRSVENANLAGVEGA